ncbi:MAG: WecB/TagA/CpsF family glycosyltransferase [Candidatus Ozemobacteraceae bacterium]
MPGNLNDRLRAIWQDFGLIFLLEVLAILRRCLDILFALGALTVLSPVISFTAFLTARRHQPLFLRIPMIGRWCEPYVEFAFSPPPGPLGMFLEHFGVFHLPRLINLLKGDLSICGPRPLRPEELDEKQRAARRAFDVRPGLFCLFAVPSFPILFHGKGILSAPEHLDILGIRIDNLTSSEIIAAVMGRIKSRTVGHVSFVTAECANFAHHDTAYLRVLRGSFLVLGDGIGLRLGGKILGYEIRQTMTGTDLFPRILSALSDSGSRVFLLGGHPGVPDRVAAYIRKEFPGIKVVGIRHGYFSSDEELDIIEEIETAKVDLLLVALGSPRQETWLARNLEKTGATIGVGVGGLFDFYSGRIPRAPQWINILGMEWAFRLYQEPGRLWKRYLADTGKFLLRVFLEKAGRSGPAVHVVRKEDECSKREPLS